MSVVAPASGSRDRDPAAIENAAELYLAKKWPVVRVRAGDKKPLETDWPSKNPRPRDFQASDNIGVNLSRAGDLVDIDLDIPAARALAAHPYFFGHLPAFGREGQPPGHRLVRSHDAPREVTRFNFSHSSETAAINALGLPKAMVLEARASEQTVFPPSRYFEDGEWINIVWETGAPPEQIPEMSWAELKRRCGLLAFLSVIATGYPAEGN